jgi:signal transduction histidine kinase
VLEAGESAARCSVKDDGPGIAPEDQAHIFERFFRGAHPGVEGSGLGLAIVRSIAQAHGGNVFVESQLGSGSKFTIELPYPSPPSSN